MPKCLLAFIAAADDYSCVPNSVSMLEVHLTSQEVETASLRVNAKKIVLSPGYLCTFDKTIKSHAGGSCHSLVQRR